MIPRLCLPLTLFLAVNAAHAQTEVLPTVTTAL
jgi:hypothetical protein